MEQAFVGRKHELEIFDNLLQSSQAELVAVIGRRRVGKTYLVKNAYKNQIDFHFTGIKDAHKDSMLTEFALKLAELSKGKMGLQVPPTWLDAFRLLRVYINSLKTKRKKIIFLDELPWLDSHKSGFLQAFEYFWNDWAVDQNVVIVVCGSSTAWMMQNILNNKAGLHNRITNYINVKPFTLAETKLLLTSMRIKMPNYEIIQLYMALGGIPYYLKEVKAGASAIQNIDKILFNAKSTLKHEFQNLYRALFDNYQKYETIVKALSTKRKGLTRQELVQITKITNGGGLTRMLSELEESSFIKTYLPFAKSKKETLYRLIDEYSVFYFQFQPHKNNAGSFIKLSNSSSYKAWAGFAFESLCFKHIHKIKDALGISGVYTTENSFYHKSNTNGFQIDLLIDRNDNAINICEAKFYGTEYELSKKEATTLRTRVELFKQITNTQKYVIPTLITTYGFKHNQNSIGIIDKVITMDSLF